MISVIPLRQSVFLALAMSVGTLPPLFAVDCSVPDWRQGVQTGNAFNIILNGFSSFDVQTAIDYWSGCQGYGPYIPPFEFGGFDGIPVTITRVNGNSTLSGGGCGSTTRPSGEITSADITIYTNQANGTSCEPLTDVIAHEFGHLLGLADVTDSSCIGHIMGARYSGGTRTVQADDCAQVDNMWVTSSESIPPDPYCDAYCQTHCVDNICQDHP